MVFSSLLPFIEATSIPTPNGLSIKQYQSPADPSFTAFPANEGNCSFAVNALLYGRGLVEDITDGSSNTIAFSERYARCQRQGVSWSLGEIICINGLTGQRVLCGVEFDRRANFADRSFVDVLPVTSGTPPNTTGSVPGLTFQTKPKPTDCDGRIVQGALPGGLIVALSDGSVRVLSPTIAPIVYWAAITPNGGEVLADW